MTDEEKRNAKKPRADKIAELVAEQTEAIKKVNKEISEAEAAEDKKPETEGKKKTKTVFETDQDVLRAFQILDRPASGLRNADGRLDKDYLAKKLIVLGEAKSLKQAAALVTLGGAQRGGPLNYGSLSRVSKEFEIEEPKVEEKKEAASEVDQAES